MLCLKKRRTYSFTQGACNDLPRRSKKDNRYDETDAMAVTTLPRKRRGRETHGPSRMVLTVTEDTPADMLAGSMELVVQLPRDHHLHTQRVTVPRSTPMMDLLVQIANAHKLSASNFTLQAVGERGLVLSHQPNTPIGALDALQVKLLPKQGIFVPRKSRQANQPFETTFRLQVHLPRNQLYVTRVSPKTNLGDILDEVCREKDLDRDKYELRHPANLQETLDPSLSLQDYHLQEVTLYAKLGRSLGSALSSQDIMALQRQEERRRQQAKQGVFGFMFKKSKESSLSTDSLGGRSVSPARSDETGRSASPLAPPARPQRKRRPAPKPPVAVAGETRDKAKEKMVISHSRNSSDSSGYHEASVLSDNPDSNSRAPETLPRRSKMPGSMESPRKLAQTSQASKSLSNLAAASGGLTMSHGVSNSSLSSTGHRKKRAAPPPPKPRPLSSAISTQGLERIVDSEESLTSDMELSKPSSDIGASSKANSDIDDSHHSKANSDVGANSLDPKTHSGIRLVEGVGLAAGKEIGTRETTSSGISRAERDAAETTDVDASKTCPENATAISEDAPKVEPARVEKKVGESMPIPKPRKASNTGANATALFGTPERQMMLPSPAPRVLCTGESSLDRLINPQPVNITKPAYYEDCTSDGSGTIPSCNSSRDSLQQIGTEPETLKSDNSENLRVRAAETFSSSPVSQKSQSSIFTGSLPIELSRFAADTESLPEIQATSEDTRTWESQLRDKEDPHIYKRVDVWIPEKPRRKTLENAKSIADHVKIDVSQRRSMELKKSGSMEQSMQQSPINQRMLRTSSLRDLRDMNNIDEVSPVKDDRAMSEERSCSIISTIPKCDHLAPQEEDIDAQKVVQRKIETVGQEKSKSAKQKYYSMRDKNNPGVSFDTGRSTGQEDSDSSESKVSLIKSEKESTSLKNQTPELPNRSVKRTKIFRSQSELDNFKINNFEKHTRHLTSPSEDFLCALNANLSADIDDVFSTDADDGKVDSFHNTINECSKKVLHNDSSKDLFSEDTSGGNADRQRSTPKLPWFMTGCVNPGRWKNFENFGGDTEPDPWMIGKSGRESDLSETDILLRKVSDTLSGSLSPPTQSPPLPPSSTRSSVTTAQAEQPHAPSKHSTENILSEATKSLDETLKSVNKMEDAVTVEQQKAKLADLSPDGTALRTSTPNMTVSSQQQQQDTSDYVSATDDDSSIADWVYQLPAPPSAFRDSHSPAFDDYDTIALGSVDAFKEPIADFGSESSEHDNGKDLPVKSSPHDTQAARESRPNASKNAKRSVAVAKPVETQVYDRQTSSESQRCDASVELKKEMISELENRIETGRLPQSGNKTVHDSDSRRSSNNSSTPAVAPVDNHLKNFVITTYPSRKSVDIFDEADQREKSPSEKNGSENGAVKDSTILRKNSNSTDSKFAATKASCFRSQSIERVPSREVEFKKPGPKMREQHEPRSEYQSFDDDNKRSSGAQRSKTSIVPIVDNSSCQKFNGETESIDVDVTSNSRSESNGDKKSADAGNDEAPKNNEKFSQWRDNILKRQEEPTKEKQLQSLQVLKSILPQLKNTQQPEENVYEQQPSNELPYEDRSSGALNGHTVPTRASLNDVGERIESESHTSKTGESIKKRYSYAGPPAINLGSWSERPRVNVQIKTDTDYKFGENNVSGAKTVVNLNGSRDEGDLAMYDSGAASTLPRRAVKNDSADEVAYDVKRQSGKKTDEFTKKVINHTTVSGFKRPVLNKVEDKPVVTGVELKKPAIVEKQESPKKLDGEIDTKPINFKELTKAFGQEVCLRAKPKHVIQHRHSDYYGSKSEVIENLIKPDVNHNGYEDSNKIAKQTECIRNNRGLSNGAQADNQNAPFKKYTSVIGIHSPNSHVGPQNGNYSVKSSSANTIKINGPMPVVKGFRIQATQMEPRVVKVSTKQNGVSVFDCRKVPQPPKPPTMPIITGVTLKSANARPKSMPVQGDPRDQLLESIRNFGGLDMLRSAAEKH